MRKWNRLSLMLPLGLALAALYVPLRLVWAANSPPTAIQAALSVGPGESTPHFFTGDTRLSSFQRLPEPVQHSLQSAAVTAAPVPNVDQRTVDPRPVEQPRPELVPAMVSAVSTVAVPPSLPQQPQPPEPTVVAVPPGKPVNWGQEQRLDTHFFPRHSPILLANYQDSTPPPIQPTPPAPRLRATEIQSVGAAQVAIAPPTSPPPGAPVAPSLPPPSIAPSQQSSPTQQLVASAPNSTATFSAPKPPAAHWSPSAAPTSFASFARSQPEIHSVQPVPAITVAPQIPHPEPPPTDPIAPPAPAVAFENKRLRGPHYFTAGPMRLASLERQTVLHAPPLKETLVQSAAAPNLPPADLAPPPAVALPPVPALPQFAVLPQPIKPQLTSLEVPSPSRLHPAAAADFLPPTKALTPTGPQLTSLITPGPEPIMPLMPAEVLAAASPAQFHEQFRLTNLQQLPSPGANLQPTEVLPIPSPFSPTAPRVPTAIDAERPIGAVSTNITDPSGRMPTDLAMDRFRGDYPAYLPRGWEDSLYFWDAPSMCIGPLRYEEVNLERFGYSHCPAIQPVLSGMHFLGATLALPYSIAARPFGTCEYPLGHYRPGSPVPFRHIRPEFRPWPATVECMTIAGLILLIP